METVAGGRLMIDHHPVTAEMVELDSVQVMIYSATDSQHAITGQPCTMLREVADTSGWHAVMTQYALEQPSPAEMQTVEIWRSHPYQYRWQAREAALAKCSALYAAFWLRYLDRWTLAAMTPEQREAWMKMHWYPTQARIDARHKEDLKRSMITYNKNRSFWYAEVN